MVIDENYSCDNRAEIVSAIRAGKIFIYPTDTIYGIGCNALLNDSVIKIRQLKQREIKPFSVIAPGMSWIKDNCVIKKEQEKYLDKLPGPYTLFVPLKTAGILSKEVNPMEEDTAWVRLPKHWFTEFIAEARVPFITTSVNASGQLHMTRIEELDETIKNGVDFIIYEGELRGERSAKIDLTK